MTLLTTDNKKFFDGDGATVIFDFAFKYFNASEIEFYVGGSLVLTSNYTLVLNANGIGGRITANTAPISGTKNVLILRNIPYTQETKIPTVDKIGRGSLENAYDKLAMLTQQVEEVTQRCLKLSSTLDGSGISMTSPAPVANNLIGYDATATGVKLFAASDISAVVLPTPTLGYVALGDGTASFTFSEVGALIDAQTAAAPAVGDKLLFADVDAANVGKEGTVQGVLNSLGTTKGDVYVHNGTNLVRVAVGTNGQALVADSAQASGVKWGTGGQGEVISTVTAVNASTVEFTTGIDGSFNSYVIIGVDILPATDDAQLFMRVSDDGGATFEADAGDYSYTLFQQSPGGILNTGSALATEVQMIPTTATAGMSDTAGDEATLELHFASPDDTTNNFQVWGRLQGFVPVGDYRQNFFSGRHDGGTVAINAVQLLTDGGNINGKFALIGVA